MCTAFLKQLSRNASEHWRNAGSSAYRVEGSTLKAARLNSFKVRLENFYAIYLGIFRTDLVFDINFLTDRKLQNFRFLQHSVSLSGSCILKVSWELISQWHSIMSLIIEIWDKKFWKTLLPDFVVLLDCVFRTLIIFIQEYVMVNLSSTLWILWSCFVIWVRETLNSDTCNTWALYVWVFRYSGKVQKVWRI